MSCEWDAGRFSDMGYYIPWWGMCQGDLLGEILGGVVIRTPEAVSKELCIKYKYMRTENEKYVKYDEKIIDNSSLKWYIYISNKLF